MKLTLKFTVAVTCAILVMLGINALIRVKREAALFEEEIRRDSRVLGRALAGAAERIWTTVGPDEAMDLVDDAGERIEGTVRWIWLDESAGARFQPAVKIDDMARLRDERRRVVVRARDPQTGDRSLYTYVPLSIASEQVGAIEVRESLAFEQEYVGKTILHAVTTTAALVLLCSGIVIGLGAVFVARPVRRLVEQARRIGAGDLSVRLDLRQRDEIGDLAREMDAMGQHLAEARSQVEHETAARHRTEEMLRHADRLTTVGKLAAGIAHEIGTPLNVITGHAQLLAEERDEEDPVREMSGIIAGQARRVAHIVRQLLDFARRRPPDKSRQDLQALIHRVASLLKAMAHERRVSLELEPSTGPAISSVDPGQIEQVVTNLVVNALQATPSGGTIAIALDRTCRARPGYSEEERWVCIRVTDTGSGMSDEIRDRIFEPFFTTKGVGEGTGLGLSVAYGIVVEHQGWIDVESQPGQGTELSIYLPEHIE